MAPLSKFLNAINGFKEKSKMQIVISKLTKLLSEGGDRKCLMEWSYLEVVKYLHEKCHANERVSDCVNFCTETKKIGKKGFLFIGFPFILFVHEPINNIYALYIVICNNVAFVSFFYIKFSRHQVFFQIWILCRTTSYHFALTNKISSLSYD